MRVSVRRNQLQAVPVPIMFTSMIATPFDLDTPLGQRRAIIRRSGDDVEMLEAVWGLRPGPTSDRPLTLIRAEGRLFRPIAASSRRPSSACPAADARTG